MLREVPRFILASYFSYLAKITLSRAASKNYIGQFFLLLTQSGIGLSNATGAITLPATTTRTCDFARSLCHIHQFVFKLSFQSYSN